MFMKIGILSPLTTEVPEIDGTPPPTAQTPGSNWLISCLETPHGNTFRGTEAISEFHPCCCDMGPFIGF